MSDYSFGPLVVMAKIGMAAIAIVVAGLVVGTGWIIFHAFQ